MVLADGADVFKELGIPAWILGLFVLTLLWWRGGIMRTTDHQAAMRAQRELCDAELATKEADIAHLRRELALQRDRLDHVVADRDAWRAAHTEAQRALHAAERAGAALMEQGQLSVGLLSALKDVLAGKAGPGG